VAERAHHDRQHETRADRNRDHVAAAREHAGDDGPPDREREAERADELGDALSVILGHPRWTLAASPDGARGREARPHEVH
jgi:hypothetical protein